MKHVIFALVLLVIFAIATPLGLNTDVNVSTATMCITMIAAGIYLLLTVFNTKPSENDGGTYDPPSTPSLPKIPNITREINMGDPYE